MKEKTTMVEALSLSPDRLSTRRLKPTAAFRWHDCFGHTFDSGTALLSKPAFGAAAKLVALTSNTPLPGPNQPGLFLELARPSTPLASVKPGRQPVENDHDHFHDSESGDIYDLYNACNGIVRDEFLDVDQLNSYTAEEAEVLNIIRLREIWEHTRTGCLQCRKIVNALRALRETAGDLADEIRSHDDTDPDINHTSSIS